MAKYEFLKEDSQLKHISVMECIAQEIAKQAGDNFVLKGGTALLLAHGLKRFSTDLDFDGKNSAIDLQRAIGAGLSKAGVGKLAITCVKNTSTVKRYKVHYEGNPENPLKVEISYREPINEKDVILQDGIYVYNIDKLAEQKTAAFVNRLTARDIFDIAFLLDKHSEKFSSDVLINLKNKVDDVGIDYLANAMSEDNLITRTCDPVTVVFALDEKLTGLITARNQEKSQPPPPKQESWKDKQARLSAKVKDQDSKPPTKNTQSRDDR